MLMVENKVGINKPRPQQEQKVLRPFYSKVLAGIDKVQVLIECTTRRSAKCFESCQCQTLMLHIVGPYHPDTPERIKGEGPS